MNAPIYLDYAATTPVDPSVVRAMNDVLSGEAGFGNASSATHTFGRLAHARIEAARSQVAALIGAQAHEIVFTSGATESNNLALLGVARSSAAVAQASGPPHIITTRIEHKAVLDPCKQLEREGFAVTYVTPDASGVVQPSAIRDAMRDRTVLVSIMHVNNEIGVIQDIRAIGETCREKGVPFHVDAAQSVGKLALEMAALPVDLLSFTAHKLYGPKGIGALYVRDAVRPMLRPILFGGGQENGLRPGTLPTHQIVGFAVACAIARAAGESEHTRIEALRDRLWQVLARLEGVHLNGGDAPRVPEILNISFDGVEGESLVTALTSLALATGSACNSASGDPSYVLRALGRSSVLAQSSLRFSFGRGTTASDVDTAAAEVCYHVRRLRAVSPAGSGKLPERPAPARQLSPDDASPAPSTRQVSDDAGDTTPDSLSPIARKYFERLPGAGAMPPGPGVVQGSAGDPAADAWVRFHLRIEGGVVKTALFQAWGCPHTLAVSAWLTGQLPGRNRDDLVPGTPSAWLQALDVPVEKLGRLLVVEDGLRAARQHWKL